MGDINTTEKSKRVGYMFNACIGGLIGIGLYIPLALISVLLLIGSHQFLDNIFHFKNINVDDVLMVYPCIIPEVIISAILGIIGGNIGYRRNMEKQWMVAASIFGVVISVISILICIIIGWMK